MNIVLSPQRREDALTLHKSGALITVNGETFDFSRLSDGDTLPRAAIDSEWFVGDVFHESGHLTLHLLLPIPADYSQAQAFPADLIDIPDGDVALPQPLPKKEVEV